MAVGVDGVRADDHACGIDAARHGALVGQRIVEDGVGAAAVEEAVVAAGVQVRPDDLTRGVDSECLSARKGKRIVERGVHIDWHDRCSSVIVSLAKDKCDFCDPQSADTVPIRRTSRVNCRP